MPLFTTIHENIHSQYGSAVQARRLQRFSRYCPNCIVFCIREVHMEWCVLRTIIHPVLTLLHLRQLYVCRHHRSCSCKCRSGCVYCLLVARRQGRTRGCEAFGVTEGVAEGPLSIVWSFCHLARVTLIVDYSRVTI